jgi:hypothetical protein
MTGQIRGRRLSFVAPGGDLLCGRAKHYQFAVSGHAITPQSFAHARRLSLRLTPARAGARQVITLPRGLRGYLAIRAVDAAGNLGRPLVLKLPR